MHRDQKKSHYSLDHNFTECRPIFKITSSTDSIVNLKVKKS